MKIFLLKTVALFSVISIGLFCAYLILDPEGTTRGDVRYIKTRNVSRDPNTYNALLIGSSRVYDVDHVTDCNFSIYNYGFIQAVPKDYPAFIKYACENQPIKKVIIGLDFFGSSKKGLNDATASWKDSELYVDDIKSENIFKSLYSIYDFPRFKRLVNYKVLGNDPFARSKEPKKSRPVNKEWRPAFWNMYQGAYTAYAFNDSLGAVYKRIKRASKGAELVVYITPESKILFELLSEKGLQDEYEQFLNVTVAHFDTVYNMMEVNEFTSSPENFKDESHLTNAALHSIVCALANREDSKLSGTVLTKDNIAKYIKNKEYLKRSIEN